MDKSSSGFLKSAAAVAVASCLFVAGTMGPTQAQTIDEDSLRSTAASIFPDFNENVGDQTFTGFGKTITASISGERTFAQLDEDDAIRFQIDGVDVFKTSGGFKHVRDIDADDFARLIDLLGVDLEQAQNIAQTEQSRAQATTTIRTIGRRIGSFLAPSPGGATATANGGTTVITGLAGSDSSLVYSGWLNFTHSWLENDGAGGQAGLDVYDGHLINGLVGADLLINDMFLVGLALSIETLDTENPVIDGTLNQDGYGIIPYLGARFFDGSLVLDALFGYTHLDSNESQLGNSFRGNFTGSRYIAGSNITFNYLVDNFILSPSVGFNFAYEFGDGYTDNLGTARASRESYIGDLKFGARAAYVWEQVEFYTSHYYVWDAVPLFSDTIHSGLDRDEIASTFGASYSFNDAFTATLEFNNSFGREDITDRSIVAGLRLNF